MHEKDGLPKVTAVVGMAREGAVNNETVTVATPNLSPPNSQEHTLHEGSMSMDASIHLTG